MKIQRRIGGEELKSVPNSTSTQPDGTRFADFKHGVADHGRRRVHICGGANHAENDSPREPLTIHSRTRSP